MRSPSELSIAPIGVVGDCRVGAWEIEYQHGIVYRYRTIVGGARQLTTLSINCNTNHKQWADYSFWTGVIVGRGILT
jgi:hypothetical protein